MALKEQLRADLAESMKRGDEARVGILRLLLAAFSNEEIAKRGAGGSDVLSSDDEVRVLKREAKKRREAIELYEQGGRGDLRAREEAELAFIAGFLPKELSRDEARAIVRAALERVEARDFGGVMKEAVREIAGRADGALVAELVREELKNGGA